jgi:hypothetical protein
MKYITIVSPSHARGIPKAVLSGYVKNANYFLQLLGYGERNGDMRKYKLNIWRKIREQKKEIKIRKRWRITGGEGTVLT